MLARVNTASRMGSQNIIYCLYAFIIVINVRGYQSSPYYVIMGFSYHWFAFYISDRKQYTSINGFNFNFTNIYGVRKGLVSGCRLFLTYISDLYRQQNISKYGIFQIIQAWTLVALLNWSINKLMITLNWTV